MIAPEQKSSVDEVRGYRKFGGYLFGVLPPHKTENKTAGDRNTKPSVTGKNKLYDKIKSQSII